MQYYQYTWNARAVGNYCMFLAIDMLIIEILYT